MLLVAAGIALIAAVLAVVLIRRKDFHVADAPAVRAESAPTEAVSAE
ncbi:hypothetical protein [Amnibacterium kyonggiense]